MALGNPDAARRISLAEKLDLIPANISLVGTVLYALVTGFLRGPSGARTYRQHVMTLMAKKLLTRFNSLQIQYTSSTYDQIYLNFCKAKGLSPEFVSTSSGVTGFWIGRKDAKYVFINFHGGGYAMDSTKTYLDFWPGIQGELSSHGVDTAWFYPTYTLTPHATYPTQFIQAVESLRYVLEDVGRKPEEVILVGDSAGGGLCLAILSHLAHPSEDVKPLQIEKPLKGMVLVAPWVSFDTSGPSMTENIHRDILAPEALQKWADDYLNGRPSDSYAEPMLAPSEWWANAKVEQALVVSGSDDILSGSINGWVDKFKEAGNEVTYVVAQNECHIAPLIWPEFGDMRETQQGQAVKSWLKKILGDGS
ncbi:alpha/beta hydrolase fold protein [Biscogniauxia mediterranea]|nr:alpha/beta hydrolase fold protein [Biscogniauxia mediterranea]